MKLRRIQKRDGREVPFDKAKISDAVARAEAAVGASDPHFAAEVADVVELALLRRYPGGRMPTAIDTPAVPGIEEIQDLVEQALIELGHAPVAKAYILYRDRRARIRAALEVRSTRDTAPFDPPLRDTPPDVAGADAHAARARRKVPPRVQVSGGLASWSKGRIVIALMGEAELPRATSEQIAARVEERVFDSGLKRISTALIRELVDNELVELGLAQALRRQRPVVLPRHDIKRLLSDPEAGSELAGLGAGVLGREPLGLRGARTAQEALAGAVLSRFAIEDLLPESVAELQHAGELFFEDLRTPHLALTQAVPCDLLLASENGPRAAYELLEEAALCARNTARGIVLEDAETLLGLLTRGLRATPGSPGTSGKSAPAARTGTSHLAPFLLALAAQARASGRAIDLAFGPLSAGSAGSLGSAAPSAGALGPRAARATPRSAPRSTNGLPLWLPRLVDELFELATSADRPRLARLFLEGEDVLALAASETAARPALELLLAEGLVVPIWGVAGERFAAPGLARGWRERGGLTCGGACAINLARAARRAGPWREDALLENAARSIENALEGLASIAEHQRRERWLTGSAPDARGRLRGRVSYAITPVGLREALRFVADGEIRPEQAARLVAFLAEAVHRFSRARGLAVTLTPWFGERAAARFAALDAEHFQVSQPLLFESGLDFRGGASTPYSTGLDLSHSGAHAPGPSALEAAQAALCAAQKSGAVHPPLLLRSLARAALEAPASVLAAFERLERTRSRLRSGAWALYALPPTAGDDAAAHGPGADDLEAQHPSARQPGLPLELPSSDDAEDPDAVQRVPVPSALARSASGPRDAALGAHHAEES